MLLDNLDSRQVYCTSCYTTVAPKTLNDGDLYFRPKNLVIADFGCGDAKLAQSVPQKVHSFDLVALNKRITVCDMSKVSFQFVKLACILVNNC